jgi:hypothetical protein
MTTPDTKAEPLTEEALDNIECMMWLADVGHPPTMAKTMRRLLVAIRQRDAEIRQGKLDLANLAISSAKEIAALKARVEG